MNFIKRWWNEKREAENAREENKKARLRAEIDSAMRDMINSFCPFTGESCKQCVHFKKGFVKFHITANIHDSGTWVAVFPKCRLWGE